MDTDKALVVFQGKEIRRTWHNDEWYFVIVDIVEVIIDRVLKTEGEINKGLKGLRRLI